MEQNKYKCCRITKSILYDRVKGKVSLKDKLCKQNRKRNTDLTACRPGKYPADSIHLDLLQVETLPNRECRNSPWCSAITLNRCYKIIEGELSPGFYKNSSSRLDDQEFPPGMTISLQGKICQRSEDMIYPQVFMHGQRWAKVDIKVTDMLGHEECEGEGWQRSGWGAAPECDDFDFWKQVLSTEGIRAPNWEASIAAAKSSSLEGMMWGAPNVEMATKDTLWNARRDTVLEVDDQLSSWS